MTQKISVQDGNILYETSDTSYSVNFTIKGQLNLGKNSLTPGLITTPVNTDLSLVPGSSGQLLLNNISWPDGLIFATAISDSLTKAQLNIAYPTIQACQIVLGPNVIYYYVGSTDWRLISAPPIS